VRQWYIYFRRGFINFSCLTSGTLSAPEPNIPSHGSSSFSQLAAATSPFAAGSDGFSPEQTQKVGLLNKNLFQINLDLRVPIVSSTDQLTNLLTHTAVQNRLIRLMWTKTPLWTTLSTIIVYVIKLQLLICKKSSYFILSVFSHLWPVFTLLCMARLLERRAFCIRRSFQSLQPLLIDANFALYGSTSCILYTGQS